MPSSFPKVTVRPIRTLAGCGISAHPFTRDSLFRAQAKECFEFIFSRQGWLLRSWKFDKPAESFLFLFLFLFFEYSGWLNVFHSSSLQKQKKMFCKSFFCDEVCTMIATISSRVSFGQQAKTKQHLSNFMLDQHY
jgi:hypothetical protein